MEDREPWLPANWAVAIVVGLLGLMGLFVASSAGDGAMYIFGLVIFIGSVLVIMVQVKRFYDKQEH